VYVIGRAFGRLVLIIVAFGVWYVIDDYQGTSTIAGRAAAIRQHVVEMPAPIVADALGYQ
jgi:hypothetical protein